MTAERGEMDITLAEARVGDVVRVVRVDHGKVLRLRLTAMGITPGTVLRVVQRVWNGPCIVAVRGTRVALGRGMLNHIHVTHKESAR